MKAVLGDGLSLTRWWPSVYLGRANGDPAADIPPPPPVTFSRLRRRR